MARRRAAAGESGRSRGRAVEDDAGVGDLAEDEEPGELGGAVGGVGQAVLGAAEEDVAGDLALDAGEETPVLGEEADLDAVLGAVAEEEGAAEDVAEADDAVEVVDGQAQAGLALDADEDGLAFFGEVAALGGDVEGVQELLHSASSAFGAANRRST